MTQKIPLRIAHCTTVHGRSDTRIFRKECRSLASVFSEVHLIVGDGQGDAVDSASGLHVLDIGRVPGGGRLARMVWQPLRLLRRLREVRPDVVHVHDAELLPVAVLMRMFGASVIYDVHEDLPKQILDKPWISAWIRKPLALAITLFERLVCPFLSALVAATPSIAQTLASMNSRIVVVNNYPITDELLDAGAVGGRRTHICFVGGITRIRGISQLIDALALLPGLRLKLCGPVENAEFMAELSAKPGWSQVDYLGVVGREGVRGVLSESFAGMVTYLPASNHIEAQPTKVFEYMSAGLPVIASDFPLWRQIVVDTGAGLCVDPANPESIAHACQVLRDDAARVASMGQRGIQLVAGELNWDHEAAKLRALYTALKAERA